MGLPVSGQAIMTRATGGISLPNSRRARRRARGHVGRASGPPGAWAACAQRVAVPRQSTQSRTYSMVFIGESADSVQCQYSRGAAERLWDVLRAPVRRLGAPRVPIAYAPSLEGRLRVCAGRIAAAVTALVAAKGASRRG